MNSHILYGILINKAAEYVYKYDQGEALALAIRANEGIFKGYSGEEVAKLICEIILDVDITLEVNYND